MTDIDLVRRNREWYARMVGWTAVYNIIAIRERHPDWTIWYDGHLPDGRGYLADRTAHDWRCRAWGREPDQLLEQIAIAEARFEAMEQRNKLMIYH